MARAGTCEHDLPERCEAIAAGREAARVCSILTGETRGIGLRFARADDRFGMFLDGAFLDEPADVAIIGFLLVHSGLPGRIAALGRLSPP